MNFNKIYKVLSVTERDELSDLVKHKGFGTALDACDQFGHSEVKYRCALEFIEYIFFQMNDD